MMASTPLQSEIAPASMPYRGADLTRLALDVHVGLGGKPPTDASDHPAKKSPVGTQTIGEDCRP